MRNKTTVTTAIFAAALTLASYPTLAQDTVGAVTLEGREVQMTMEDCRTALERGQLLKIDETGAYHLFISAFLFVIKVDETEMVCRAYRHVFKG